MRARSRYLDRLLSRSCAVVVLAWLLVGGRALAQQEPPADAAFRYAARVDDEPLRAVIEQIGLLGLGSAQYFVNQSENSPDWDHSYSLETLAEKMTGSHYTLDTNSFDVNFVGHQFAGTIYYVAARGNRLSWPVAYAFAATSSALWEILGELRENASVNDLIVTPTSGLVLGESFFQLGAFFDRSCPSTANAVAGTLFAPTKAIHDALDGAQLLRDRDCDRNGFTRHGEHRLELALGGGVIFSEESDLAAPVVEATFVLHTRIFALGRYGAPGRGNSGFADANATEMWFAHGLTGTHWTELSFRAAIVPLGWHRRSIEGVADGHRTGDELLLGMLLGTEYAVHRFDASTAGKDRIFLMQGPGAVMLYRRHAGSLRFEGELQASPTIAGIEAFALGVYTGSSDRLPSIAALQGYNYAGGLTLFPRARLYLPSIELGAELSATRVWAITAMDRYSASGTRLSSSEGRYLGSGWITFGPSAWPVRPSLRGSGLHRFGSIRSARATRTEWRLGAGVGAVL
jgi:hypothetical protein